MRKKDLDLILASYESVPQLLRDNKIMREALEDFIIDHCICGLEDETAPINLHEDVMCPYRIAKEALEKVSKKENM